MKKYNVYISGCDDDITVEMELTPSQLKTIELLESKVSEISVGGCQPTMEVTLKGER